MKAYSSFLLSALCALMLTICASVPLSGHAADPTVDAVPSFQSQDMILFIGDSITDGGRQRSGNDYNHTMGQDYVYILAATLGNRLAERRLTFINRGQGGNRVVDLQARWKTDVLDLKPQYLSILIGVNDTFWSKGQSVEEYERIYDQILTDTKSALPNTKIILGEPFLLPVGKYKDNYATQFAELKKRQDVVERLAAKRKLPLIRYQAAFNEACKRAPAEHWSWDGVHPHYAGHGLMAEVWLKAATLAWP